jgi:hypothetical protein
MLTREKTRRIFVNVKNGYLEVYKDGKKETFGTITGKIVGVEFIEDKMNAITKEKVQFFMDCADDKYILQMELRVAYFRSFCNALRTGDHHSEISVIPTLKTDQMGKKVAHCFVMQNNKYLKHYFTKDFNGKDGDFLPELDKVQFMGKLVVDNTKQTQYWINWLKKTYKNGL